MGAARSDDAPLALSLTSASLAIAGAALGLALYRRGPRAIAPVALSDAARRGFFVDESYTRLLVGPFHGLAAVLDIGSETVVQRSLDAVAVLATWGSAVVRRAQVGYVRVYEAMLLAAAVVLLAYWSLR